jgi:putative heme iron utilization protein
VLSTSLAASDGWPYGSLVMIAVDHDLSPILLLSDLAEHTKNLAADARVSLLIDGTGGAEDPLSAPRVTLLGRIARSEDRGDAARYIAHHPAAALPAGFADFHYYRLTVERAHLVAGFGRISWLEAEQLRPPVPDALVRDERRLIDALNQDAGLVRRLAAASGADGADGWKIAGIDRDGIDLRQRGRALRTWFERPVDSVDDALGALETMLRPRMR